MGPVVRLLQAIRSLTKSGGIKKLKTLIDLLKEN
jgi:hypothetical protein